MKEVKSITAKDVLGRQPKPEDFNKPLVYITGLVDSKFTINGKYGENIGLKGDFVAVNALDGEKYHATGAFLPAQVMEPILDQLKEGVIEIEFTCCIQAVESDMNSHGFAWIAEAPQTEERKAKAARLLENANNFPLAIENKSEKK